MVTTMTEQAEKTGFFFIQMSDPQLGMFTANRDFDQEIELFTWAIGLANRLRPAFVMVTGDMTNEPMDKRQGAEALRIGNTINSDIPIYWLAGNHDVGDAPTGATLGWFRETVGDDWYAFEHGGWDFVTINSCIIHNPTYVQDQTDTQWDWLNEKLARLAQKRPANIVIFMHHPLFLSEPDEVDDYFNIPRKRRGRYLDLFKKYGIRKVFNGHLHQNNIATDGDLEVVTTGPVGMPLGDAVSGLRIVKVNGDNISHRYYDINEVPGQLEL